MRNVPKIALLVSTAALSGILSGFGSAPAMAIPSQCDSIAGNLVANCGFENGNLSGWTVTGNPGFTGATGPGFDDPPDVVDLIAEISSRSRAPLAR